MSKRKHVKRAVKIAAPFAVAGLLLALVLRLLVYGITNGD